MISRKTTKSLGSLYESRFSRGYPNKEISRDELYDFLYENSYEAYFCNMAKSLFGSRSVKEWIMELHTGETLVLVTKDWDWKEREKLGQRLLKELAEDIINNLSKQEEWMKSKYTQQLNELIKNLELDGYIHRDSQLFYTEADVLDIQEEQGILEKLYSSLDLANEKTAFHHLGLSEKHYTDSKWDDSIANSRKFLECTLQEVAAKHSIKTKKIKLNNNIFSKPVEVRNYLEKEGLLETKEKEALSSIYSLLSSTGGHPYMAENEQARLLRHLALTFSQFVMLRLEGNLRKIKP